MKRIKYLLIIATLLITPIVAKAEPIHLTQAALEECFANEGVYNEKYKMTFKLETFVSGFFLSGEEYILDEDIDVHKAHLAGGPDGTVVNMNGHKITSQLDKYSPVPGYLSVAPPVGCSEADCDLTLNGPGRVESFSASSNAVLMEGGKITVNDVDLFGCVRTNYQGNPNDIHVTVNNSQIHGRFELWNSIATIKNTKVNMDFAWENQCLGCNLTLDNVDLGYDDLSNNNVNGIYISEEDGYVPEVKISNSRIKAGSDHTAVSIGQANVSINNSYLTTQKGYVVTTNHANANLLLRDTHLEITNPFPTYYRIFNLSRYHNLNTVEEVFNSIIPSDYIYYDNPSFQTQTQSFNGEEYILHYLANTDIWIIKPTEPTVEIGDANDTTYVIPEENEIIIKVLGYKFLFNGLKINGTELPTDNYQVLDDGLVSNEVTIKLNNDYLKTLGVDDYQVEVLFANGSANATLSVKDIEVDETPTIQEEVKGEEETVEDKKEEKKNPKTGLFNYMILLVPLAIVGIVYIVISKKTYFKGM